MLIYDEQKNFNNDPIETPFFSTVPLAASIGAKLVGLDINTLTDASFEAFAGALYHHKMIYLRDQEITPETQEALTLRFGEFGTDAYTKGLEGHPNIQPVVKEAETKSKMVFGGGWHTDSPFLQRPPSVSLLYALEIPPYGGDTIWYNSALAYNNLSDVMKQMLAPLKIHMSGEKVVASLQGLMAQSKSQKKPEEKATGEKATGEKAIGDMSLEIDVQAMIDGAFHPLVRTHPVTGQKALFVDKVYAKNIEGMNPYESAPLIDFLVSHITQEVFSCRLRWAPKTLCLWDNRLCLHRAFNDYDGHRRELHRTTVIGETPA
jgi:taurine dioxygenase